jgi:hypothetical protein
MATFIERYHSQEAPHLVAQREQAAKRENLRQLRVAAFKAMEERHSDELEALRIEFDQQFDILNGRGAMVKS